MKIRKIDYEGRHRWEVDAGRIAGKRRRFFFNTERAARTKVRQLEAEREQIGRSWAHLSAAERVRVLETLKEIEAAGFTLQQVWTAFSEGKMTAPPPETPLRNAIDELIVAKRAANRRERYLQELERYLNAFAKGREQMPVSSFNLGSLLDWFSSRNEAPATKASNMGKLSALFDFCYRKGTPRRTRATASRGFTSRSGFPRSLRWNNAPR